MRVLYRLYGLIRTLQVAAFALLVLLLLWMAVQGLATWWGAAILAGGLVVLVVVGRHARRWVPRRTILEVDLERGVVERAPEGPAGRVTSRRVLALRDLLDALERGARDRRVVGLLARVGSFRPGLAVAQEIRDAVLAFRAAGKRAVAWGETFGEGHSATVEVYLASAFDEILVQPTGEVGLDGVLLDHPFVRGTLDRIGVEPQLGHRREYKTAKYLFTERAMNEPHRVSAKSLMDSQVDQIVEGIAAARGLEKGRVRDLLDIGPFRAKDALEAGIVDGVAYRDEVYDAMKEKLRGRILHIERYLKRAGRPRRKGAVIAVIHGVGTIARGRSRPHGAPGGARMGVDDVAAAFRKAVKSKRVKAIVLRIDSPGGSAVASDVIWREVKRAREKGTPVVASMGNVAASGGYYIACGAEKIVAQPGTITGSIGVVWGKFATRDAWRRIGVDWDSLKIGAHADLWSGVHRFDEAAWAKVEGILDAVYDDFKRCVAEGRALAPERVEALARGRVWTGVQAKASGLVDELGGLACAVDVAKEAAGIAPDAPVRLKPVLGPRTFAWLRPEESSEASALVEQVRQVLEPLLGAPPGRLSMPPLHLSTDAGRGAPPFAWW